MKRGSSTSTSTSTSPSRLSPLAQPFTFKRPPSDAAAAYAYYAHHSDASASAFPYDDPCDFQSYPYFQQYPSHTLQLNADFSFLTDSDLDNKSPNFSSFKDNTDGGASTPTHSFVKQGKPAAEGLKHYGEASISQDPQSQPSYPAPVTTWSYCDSKIALKERCLSQLDSYIAKPPTVSQSSEYNSSVLISIPSGTSTTLSLINPVLSENVDFCGNDALTGPHVLLNAKEKVVCHDKILTDKGKERKDDEPATIGAMDPLVKAYSKLQIICPSVPNNVTLKPHGAEAGVPAENSSVLYDHSDSDLDSPCWKGTQVYQATSGVSEPVSAQLIKNETQASNSLNPLAPQFYPGSAKLNVNYHENECDGDDLSYFKKTASLAVALSAREHRLIDSVKAGTCPSEVSSAIGKKCSKHTREPEKSAAHGGSTRSSLLSSSCSIQPYLVEDFYTSNCQLVTGSKNAGSLEGVKNAGPNGSTSVSSLVTENVMKSSSSRVGVSSELTKTLCGASKSTPPRTDVQLVVKTMHDLSEVLIQNCSNDLGSLNEHEHEIIENIINNLHMCMRNKGRERAAMPESSNLCTTYNLRKSADCHKSNMEFQVTRMKTMTIPHDQERQKRFSTMSCEKVLESFSPRSGEGIERGNGLIQVIEKALEENHQIEEDMHTQALLYRNLWLEAEKALCYMKYKAGQMQIRQKIRVDDSSLVGRDDGEAMSRVCLRLSGAHKLW